jgi:hypothetical protein
MFQKIHIKYIHLMTVKLSLTTICNIRILTTIVKRENCRKF